MKKLSIFLLGLFLSSSVLLAQNLEIEQMGEDIEVTNFELTDSFGDTATLDFGNTDSVESLAVAGTDYYASEDSVLGIVKNFANWTLGLLGVFSIFIFFPVGIILLVQGNKDPDYSGQVDIDSKKLENIYSNDKDLSIFSHTEIEKMKSNNIQKKRRVFRIVFLNIITFGAFGFFYFGLKHEDLPLLVKSGRRDFRGGKAIGFSFIPLFNIYRGFVFRLRLIKRLNFQMKIRNQKHKVWLGLMLGILIADILLALFGLINETAYTITLGLSLISFLVLKSIIFAQMQIAMNIMFEDILDHQRKLQE